MADIGPEQDPGWSDALKSLWRVALPIPYIGRWQARRFGTGRHGLVTLRLLFLNFVSSLVLFGCIVPFVRPSAADVQHLSATLVVSVLVAAGLVSVVLPRALERPLDCTDDGTLAGTYRVRFFLRVALAESAALAGFVAVFISGYVWAYYLGLVFSAIGFARLAPTARNLRRDEEELRITGCGRSLIAALAVIPPWPTGRKSTTGGPPRLGG